MILRFTLAAAVLLSTAAVYAADPSPANSAFQQGKAFASGQTSGLKGKITTGSGQDAVPNFGGNAPEQNYFQKGNGQLFGFGQSKLTGCSSGPTASSPYKQQECDAVNFLSKNPENRVKFNVDKNDPIIVNSGDVIRDPSSVAAGYGNGSTYQNCTQTTQTKPATYTSDVCQDYTPIDSQICTVGLVVDVNADSNFQCKKSISAYESYTCNKQVIVSATPGSTTTTTQTVCDEGNYVAYGKYGKPSCDTGCYSGYVRCVDGNCYPFCMPYTYWNEFTGQQETRCNEYYVYEGGVGGSWPLDEITAGMDKSMSCGRWYTSGLNGMTLTKYGVQKTVTVQNPPVITTTINNGCAALESRAQ